MWNINIELISILWDLEQTVSETKCVKYEGRLNVYGWEAAVRLVGIFWTPLLHEEVITVKSSGTEPE